MWFSCDPTSLWSSRPSHYRHILLFPRRGLPQNFQTSFDLVSSRNSDHDAVTVPVKKDRNAKKTRTRTVCGVKGRKPGVVLSEGELVIPDERFPPQPQHSGQQTCKSVRFRTGSVPSPIFSHYLSPPSYRRTSLSERSVRSLAVLEIVNRAPCASPLRVTGVPSSSLLLSPKPQTLHTLTNEEHHRSPPAVARIRLPLLSTSRCLRPR